jgi:predicted transcriptional regulator
MRFSSIFFAFLAIFSVCTPLLGAPKVGDKFPPAALSGEAGGKVDGSPWSSAEITGKIWAFFYVDPDKKSTNEKMEAALKAENFPKDKYSSMAVINMDATWLPNAAIASALADKQKEFPNVVYAKDLKKALVKQWGLKDDSYNVLVFNKDGSLLYYKADALSDADIKEMIGVIRKAIGE